MEQSLSPKIIVSNKSALKSLYGDDLRVIEEALNELVESDQGKGIQTQVIYLDDTNQMEKLNAPPVADPTSDRQNKDAVDGVFEALMPDYLMILGGVDIIPHQKLDNPVFADPDPDVPSDLPYACDTPYSKEISDFIGPTRVVGRLPGITGRGDASDLTTAIKEACSIQSQPRDRYLDYFSVSAEVWRGSTTQSLSHIFGNSSNLMLSPPSGPNWTNNQLAALTHFVNCHGADSAPTWYGQSGYAYPEAVKAAQITGKITAGAVAAAECCYGAQLYDPSIVNGQISICNTYLENRACAFCGSTNIAYGPADGQGEADLITQYFLIVVLTGESIGRAMLESRQRYIREHSPLHPVDLKTLAQFVLLGDPSCAPVEVPEMPKAMAVPHVEELRMRVGKRRSDRVRLAAQGIALVDSVGFSAKRVELTLSDTVSDAINAFIETTGLVNTRRDSFQVTGGKSFQAMQAKAIGQEIFHLTYGELKSEPAEAPAEIPAAAIIIVKERAGNIVSTEVVYRK